MLWCVGRSLSSAVFVGIEVVTFVLIFFFQAEDGIRDWSVTGVQTCALPISTRLTLDRAVVKGGDEIGQQVTSLVCRLVRSEERRVGKECRSQWSPDH